MEKTQQSLLLRSVRVLTLLTFSIAALYYAQSFLIPVCFAALLAMLLMPVNKWLERKRVPLGFASLISTLLLVSVFAGLIAILAWQLSDLLGNLQKLEQMVNNAVSRIQQMIHESFSITPKEQTQMVQEQSQHGGSAAMATKMVSRFMSILVDIILTLVYIFLFLYFRGHIKNFIFKLVPQDERSNARTIISDAGKVAQQYITGLGSMIVLLWVMYGIGFSIVGVKNAIFFAILCGILEIVPFVGNLTGTTITVLMTFAQGGDAGMVIGVVVTYAIVQFIQTYILEPLVVGSEVNINPLFTVMVLVLGELLWGIPGMILAIPLLGILKIIFDHIEPLKPYGYLIGGDKRKSPGLLDKLRKKSGKRK
ncbi:MAG TPA: AI-2E family transporter [Chitinophagaceae bacterium]